MGENDTIQNPEPFYISYLFYQNEDREERFEHVHHDFRYKLVDYIA